MIDELLQKLFAERQYNLELLILYILAGTLAGLTRLIIKGQERFTFRSWWNDGSLIGAIIISIVGALLIDNNFVWAFLGGYFIIYILRFIRGRLDKVIKTKDE